MNNEKLEKRGLYFLTIGEYKGSFLLHIMESSTREHSAFLLMPDFDKVFILKKEIPNILKSNGLEYVKTLPESVYSVCRVQYDALDRQNP